MTPAPRERPPRPVDASMTLLNRVMSRPIEPEYETAAVQRSHGARRRMPALVALLAVILGVVTVCAVIALRAPAPDQVQARTLLEQEVRDRSATNEALRAQNEALDAEIQGYEALVPQAAGLDAEYLQDLAVATGTAAVEGPGLRITLDDAEEYKKDPATADPALKVRDTDLQVVVNGLWEAHAEAVSINGVRVESGTAIRAAGETIMVDVVPLASPYVIEAIGDGARMETALARGAAGRRLALLKDNYSIPVKMTKVSDLQLQGGAVPSLKYATLPQEEGASS